VFQVIFMFLEYSNEGLEKVTRGGTNGGQSEFLKGTRPISRNQPNMSLF
jgi:hypothetical protein